MDAVSHVIVADAILSKLKRISNASAYSILPILDNKPLHYHRMYFHSLSRLPILAQRGRQYFNDNIKNSYNMQYEVVRILEEDSNIKTYLKDAERILAHPIGISKTTEPPPEDICVSLLSHLYLDTFNNPIQPFTPEIVYPAGRWKFWKEIDWETYRLDFYQPCNLEIFHFSLNNELYNIQFSSDNLVDEIILDMIVDLIKNSIIPYYEKEGIYSSSLLKKVGNFLECMDVRPMPNLESKLKFKLENFILLDNLTVVIEKCIKDSLIKINTRKGKVNL